MSFEIENKKGYGAYLNGVFYDANKTAGWQYGWFKSRDEHHKLENAIKKDDLKKDNLKKEVLITTTNLEKHKLREKGKDSFLKGEHFDNTKEQDFKDGWLESQKRQRIKVENFYRGRKNNTCSEKSDGGSSSYYKLTVRNKAGESIDVEVGDIIRDVLNDDFNLGNMFKALRRVSEAKQGRGKDGTSINYDMKKVVYFAEEYAFWNGEK